MMPMVPQSLSPRNSRPAAWPVLARLAAPFFLAGLVLVAWLLILSPPWSRPAVAAGTRRYVAPGGECGVPSPCYSRVQEAVNAATAGEEIRVAAGIYTDVVGVSNLTQTVFIDKNLTLRGGYVITDWETSRPIDRPTILDPQGLGRVIVITGPITVT
jgi:pectin methylesterase-like acyl-CoA thioesterase